MCGMGDRRDRIGTRRMTCPELLLGFAVLVVFLVVLAFVFAALGVEPATEVGPLPWMVK